MQFLHRLGYYLGGFSVGLVLLFFLFNGKRTQCHYGPQARVLNDLSKKEWDTDADVKKVLDSSSIQQILKGAKVDFSASETKRDSCNIYQLIYEQETTISLRIKNCKSQVVVLEVTKLIR